MTDGRLGQVGGEARTTIAPPLPATGTVPTDGRLLRGDRTRRIVLRVAVDVASLDGLGGVSFGRLATATGLSKAGIQTLFATKEALQLATADYARRMFIEAVIEPVSSTPRGLARVRALVERWMAYARTPLFEGGCFWAATSAEFDSRPGPVRDLLFAHQAAWVSLLEQEAGHAVAAGELAEQDPGLLAFQLDAVLRSANIALRLGDEVSVVRAERIVEAMLGIPR